MRPRQVPSSLASRRIFTLLLVLAVALATGTASAQDESPGEDARTGCTRSRLEVLAWQAALESRGFSPGLIDGIAGEKTLTATRAFQAWAGLPVTGELSEETSKALELEGAEPLQEYRVLSEDERQVSYCPPDWNEKSRRRRLLYPTLSSCIAEKFHTSERCLAALNPTLDLATLKAGVVVQAPSLRKRVSPEVPVSIEIDLSRKLLLLVDASGKVHGLLHCSVAKDVDSVERGETRIATMVEDPTYTFDPEKWPEVRNVRRKLLIPPGPRCPVGIRWLGLERPGVGIHGTAEPENIGKTGSHGCFRLTNWDAAWLASVVSPGTSVRILDRSAAADRIIGESLEGGSP